MVRREALNGHESKVRQPWFQHYCHSHNKRHSWVNRDGIIGIIVLVYIFIESTCFEIGYSTAQYGVSAVDGSPPRASTVC